MNLKAHSFHIPVMGLGYTVDTPVKVAHLGISSVVSIVDDFLMEKMREFYSKKFDLPFKEISTKVEDFRAKRVTAYLNLVDKLVSEKYEEMVNNFQQKSSELEKYFELLPDAKSIKERFNQMIQSSSLPDVKNWLRKNLTKGDIDVNIMTKLDKVNYANGEALPTEFNDAHAALRGFANSTLCSSLVLSAGMNPRLYSYIENFDDFYPNAEGQFKKKVTLKVSDYRSALIQGRFLAKKGIWVSEYRIESGLNCGGHAFATQGYLLGPILDEFREKREELEKAVFDVFQKGLEEKGKNKLEAIPEMKITAQGGVGSSEEHNFLLDEYKLDSIGWGSPFMLVPEACHIDKYSLELLRNSGEDDFYLSDASPLGVHFNNVRHSSQQKAIEHTRKDGKVGFPCTKRYLVFNTEFTDQPICTASRRYQTLKIEEIQKTDLSDDCKQWQIDKLAEKECLCEGLSNSTYLANEITPDSPRQGVSICPGPNLAYFNKIASLKEMVDHIYGKFNLLEGVKRPNLFMKELSMYVDYLEKRVEELRHAKDEKQASYYRTFRKNMQDGIVYYKDLFAKYDSKLQEMKQGVIAELENISQKIEAFHI
ncbi:hypothetical protein [Mangrovibacterium diazotrophicum]|uniref:Uncharacterized protein n=1 Tax=Mangrovibacterium diazotrophicum TaxID=1261403 RepID=A0A419VZ55_9BACT|nr:hypothetical protein [Mangrovibacterium diazotrophicum]RKD88444.1 hypothetical protein BC643_3593 [Mangrovibacterium diazotrophicum]